MAVSANTVWEFRTTATGSMVNGGGFVTGASGTDYSQQNAAQYNLTGVTTAAANAVLLTASAAAVMVGNIAHIISGTNFTAGWYEIVSVVVGVSITLDRTCASAAGALGVVNIGGALDLAGTLQDSFFETIVGGNTVWIKAGTYTHGAASVSVASTASTSQTPSNIYGYNATRGDKPTGSTRPLINMGAQSWILGQYQNLAYVQFYGTAAAVLTTGVGSDTRCVKSTCTSTTAARAAITVGTDSSVMFCEGVSLNGIGINVTGNNCIIFGCYAHDSNIGISVASSRCRAVSNLVESCRTAAVNITSSGVAHFVGNTLYGSEAKIGTGILIAAALPASRFINNIIYGFVTGIDQTTAQYKSNTGAYNSFYNNTTNATNYTLDATDITASNPTFSGATQITGSTADISAAGTVLTQSGGDMSTVEDGVDCVRIVSGTNATVGIYRITSHTATSVTISENDMDTGTTAGNVVWVIPTGHNFAIGTPLKAAGFPGLFPGSATTGYNDIGAVQRQEAAAAAGGSYAFIG